MTNEEIQRVMEFVVKQQESFADNMAKSEERTANLERAFVGLFNLVTDIGKAQKALTERVAELAEAQAHTDRRVNALIDIIEDQRRDGRSQA
ncbi:MAG TPA: hypothetical protein VN228_12200 [Pyrinomonadaceae bacterium]|nr:hypothetical protein [Pyrinomonadaceae bacterium]